MPDLTDEYTYDIDAARAAAIPMMQRAARDEAEYLEGKRPLQHAYAKAVDDVLTWLGGEVSDDLIGSARIRNAAKAALTVQTTACRHCGHGIGYSETEGWVAPDAGFDREGGDGIWRDMCPDRDDEPNPPHEPMTEADVEAIQTEVEADEGGYTEEVDAAEITQSQVTVQFRAQAWVNDNAIEVDAEGETEWRVSVATAEAIPASLERGSDLDWVKGDRYTPLWIREFQGPFEIEVVDDEGQQAEPYASDLPVEGGYR